ncbi:MAG TPA: maleylpyruvate isomerase N-terminal domain-containing protein [Actinomycetota bacterium]|nr:maleylpyruvate isomerase N-terminal domain-containing protein [Actinomycetota bacterium]
MSDDVASLIDRDEAAAALRTYTSRLCTILRDSPDPDERAIGIWTVGEVANHIASGIENYSQWMQDRDAPDLDELRNMSAWNVETVRALARADLPQLADRIEVATDAFVEAAAARSASSEVRWYAGNRIPVGVAVCMRLIEAAVHGRDVAVAGKRQWQIERDDARMMAYGLGYIGPYFVHDDALDFEGTVRVRVRGGADLYYVVRDQRLRVATDGPRPHWHLSVDPVAWVLVTTERRNQWSAAIRGQIFGWGTRPDLPFKLRAATFQG